MTGQIKMANMPSVAKSINFNNVQVKDIGQDKCTISFELENYKENTPVFITLNNMTRKEITTAINKVDTHYEYVLDGLNSNSRYSFYLSVKANKNEFLSNIYSFITIKITVYGVRVDETNSDPSTCVTYIEDSVKISTATSTSLGGWGSISLFNKIKLVGFKNGKETGDINPNDKTKYLNGQVMPQDVDVMVKIPKVYWDFTNTSNGYELRISESKFNKTCDCYAHKVGGIEKDYIYVGAYLGYVEGNKLRSRSGVSPTVSTTLTNFRNYAHNVGSGYQQFNWFTLILLQNLYLLAYKNLNSQSALGKGVSNGSKTNTGGTNTKGMIFGSTNASQQICFLGIEDFYGNVFQWVDGMFHNNSYQVTVTPDNRTFNDNGSGFRNVGKFVSGNSYGMISKVAHTNEGGYFGKEFNGSDTTYYCDYGRSYGDYFAVFGGHYVNGSDVGAFFLHVYYGASESNSFLGSRLVFLG